MHGTNIRLVSVDLRLTYKYKRLGAKCLGQLILKEKHKIWHTTYIDWFSCLNRLIYPSASGPGSSVGIATYYGLDGPRSNPGGDEIFRPSRPALRPNQLPVQWVPGLSRG